MNFKYTGDHFTVTNPNDPLASQMVGKANDVMGYGVAGYQSQGLRAYSNAVPDPSMIQTVQDPYISDLANMMNDYMDFLSTEYFEDIGVNMGTTVRIKAYGGYKFVDLDPTPELWHGRTRTLGEVCTTMYTQRYASWLAWTKESSMIPSEVEKRNILKQELTNDFLLRVPSMVSYHATIMESSHIYGACKDSYAEITADLDTDGNLIDGLDVGTFSLLHNSFKFHEKANSTTKVVMNTTDFAGVIQKLVALPIYSQGNVPMALQSAYDNDLDSFKLAGIEYKRNKLLDVVPQGFTHPVLGETNTAVDVGMALVMGGKFGRRTTVANADVSSEIVEKDYGTVVPFDLLNEVASFAYRLYFGVSVIDPTLVVAYFYASNGGGELCLKNGCVEDFYALGSARYTTRYNRRVANPLGNGETNNITFETPVVTMVPGGVGVVQATPKYADSALHLEMSTQPNIYKEDMLLLAEQYYSVFIDTNNNIAGIGRFEFPKDAVNRTAISTVNALPTGEYTVKIVHNQDMLRELVIGESCETCIDMTCPHFGADIVADFSTTTTALLCEISADGLSAPQTQSAQTQTISAQRSVEKTVEPVTNVAPVAETVEVEEPTVKRSVKDLLKSTK